MTQPGTLPFQIESKLGQGGMGAVYLARDPRTQRHVALKLVLNTHLAALFVSGELSPSLRTSRSRRRASEKTWAQSPSHARSPPR